ncbi:hypothetical protein [Magnetovibrio sp.]|uniref:hypothetical protein n=1 Tax=Magnetovibrio sp. TaxID=2024836 RepID=UPI002F92BAA2
MSKSFAQAAAELADTSYSQAVEHALHEYECGKTSRQILEDIGMGHAFDNPTPEDVVFALAHVHRRLPKPGAKPVLPKHAFSGPNVTKLDRQKIKPVTRHCLKCDKPFQSRGHRICPRCTKANRERNAGGDLGGLYA